MAKKKTKDSSFSKSSLEKTDAYNAKNKVRIAKESLDKKKKQIKSLESAILKEAALLKNAQKYVSDMSARGVRGVRVNPNMEKILNLACQKEKHSSLKKLNYLKELQSVLVQQAEPLVLLKENLKRSR